MSLKENPLILAMLESWNTALGDTLDQSSTLDKRRRVRFDYVRYLTYFSEDRVGFILDESLDPAFIPRSATQTEIENFKRILESKIKNPELLKAALEEIEAAKKDNISINLFDLKTLLIKYLAQDSRLYSISKLNLNQLISQENNNSDLFTLSGFIDYSLASYFLSDDFERFQKVIYRKGTPVEINRKKKFGKNHIGRITLKVSSLPSQRLVFDTELFNSENDLEDYIHVKLTSSVRSIRKVSKFLDNQMIVWKSIYLRYSNYSCKLETKSNIDADLIKKMINFFRDVLDDNREDVVRAFEECIFVDGIDTKYQTRIREFLRSQSLVDFV